MPIRAHIVAHSKHPQTNREIITFEGNFHRFLTAEVNTHRVISKNGQSSRAVPLASAIQYILDDTAMPVYWGQNQRGMVADNQIEDSKIEKAKRVWLNARDSMIEHARELEALGVHKQLTNRLIENFSYQRAVFTATTYDNLFWLRLHKDAQPEFQPFVQEMYDAVIASTPRILQIGEWHTPYFRDGYWSPDMDVPLEEALKISGSCCAQVSYRKLDDSLDKANLVFDNLHLFDEDDEVRRHSSPVEHQATPIDYTLENPVVPGVTHLNVKDGTLSSANFEDFIQYRQLIPNQSCTNYPNLRKS